MLRPSKHANLLLLIGGAGRRSAKKNTPQTAGFIILVQLRVQSMQLLVKLVDGFVYHLVRLVFI